MHIEVLEDNLDIKKLLKEANDIKVRLNTGWSRISQIGLQGIHKDMNAEQEHKNSLGRFRSLDYPESYFKYTLWNTPTINKYIEKYGLYRSRIMISKPKTCLSMHRDLSKRIHIPLFSGEGCVMIIGDRVYKLEPGKIYLTNTTIEHTAVNASDSIRAHIVGCMYE